MIAKLSFVKESFVTSPPDFLNISILISLKRLMIGIRSLYKKWSHLNGLSNGIIKFENCRSSVFGDRGKGRKLSCDLGEFPEMTLGRKMFFNLSMLNIQWENKGYSICQIVQNNNLPTLSCQNGGKISSIGKPGRRWLRNQWHNF